MQKSNKHPTEPETDNCQESSENISENEKYIKKLALQRSVLNKLVDNSKKFTSSVKSTSSQESESNQS